MVTYHENRNIEHQSTIDKNREHQIIDLGPDFPGALGEGLTGLSLERCVELPKWYKKVQEWTKHKPFERIEPLYGDLCSIFSD